MVLPFDSSPCDDGQSTCWPLAAFHIGCRKILLSYIRTSELEYDNFALLQDILFCTDFVPYGTGRGSDGLNRSEIDLCQVDVNLILLADPTNRLAKREIGQHFT